jgi:hypothetical protein
MSTSPSSLEAYEDSPAADDRHLDRVRGSCASSPIGADEAAVVGANFGYFRRPSQLRSGRHQPENAELAMPSFSCAQVDAARVTMEVAARIDRANTFMDTCMDTDFEGNLRHRSISKAIPCPDPGRPSRVSEGFSCQLGLAGRCSWMLGTQNRVTNPCSCKYCTGIEIPEYKRARKDIGSKSEALRLDRFADIREEAEDLLNEDDVPTNRGRVTLDAGSEDEKEVGQLTASASLTGGHAQHLEEERVRLFAQECCDRAKTRARDLDQCRSDFESRIVQNPRVATPLEGHKHPHQVYGNLPGYHKHSKGEATLGYDTQFETHLEVLRYRNNSSHHEPQVVVELGYDMLSRGLSTASHAQDCVLRVVARIPAQDPRAWTTTLNLAVPVDDIYHRFPPRDIQQFIAYSLGGEKTPTFAAMQQHWPALNRLVTQTLYDKKSASRWETLIRHWMATFGNKPLAEYQWDRKITTLPYGDPDQETEDCFQNKWGPNMVRVPTSRGFERLWTDKYGIVGLVLDILMHRRVKWHSWANETHDGQEMKIFQGQRRTMLLSTRQLALLRSTCRTFLMEMETYWSNLLDLAVVRQRSETYMQAQRYLQIRDTSWDQMIMKHPARTLIVDGVKRPNAPWASFSDLIEIMRTWRLFTLGTMLRNYGALSPSQKRKCRSLHNEVTWPQGDWGGCIGTVVRHYYTAVSPMIAFQGFRNADLQPPLTAFDDQADLRPDHLYDSEDVQGGGFWKTPSIP